MRYLVTFCIKYAYIYHSMFLNIFEWINDLIAKLHAWYALCGFSAGNRIIYQSRGSSSNHLLA